MEVLGKVQDATEFKSCEPCNMGDKVTRADGFCGECSEFMCHECFRHHLKSKFCRNHVMDLIDVSEIEGKDEGTITEHCSAHTKQPLRYYCCDHDKVACGDCLVAEHHGCKMQFIADLAKNFKDSSMISSMVEEIQQIEHEAEDCGNVLKSKREENIAQTETTINDIKDFRQRLHKHLDNGENQLIGKVKVLSKENEIHLSVLEEKVANVNVMTTEIKNAFNPNEQNDYTLFIHHVEFEPVLQQLRKAMEDIKSNEQIVSFSFEPENCLTDLIEQQTQLGNLIIAAQNQFTNGLNEDIPDQETSSDCTNDVNNSLEVTKKSEHYTETKEDRTTQPQLVGESILQKMVIKDQNVRGVILTRGPNFKSKLSTFLPKLSFFDSFKLNYEDIATESLIRKGETWDVFKGTYKKKAVAVKVSKEAVPAESHRRFLEEGRVLKQYQHPNIEQLIGMAFNRDNCMVLLMEYMPGGTLLNYLRTHGETQSRLEAAQMCVDIASGMAYLAEKGCLHMDLAARNCLVGDNRTVKISALGMTTDVEFVLPEGTVRIPIKWTSVEVLNHSKYTIASDVWSFGIIMWEIFSNGQTPYPGWTNLQAEEAVEQGYRMPAPDNTPYSIYELMLKCWDNDVQTRVTFGHLYKQLSALVAKPPEGESWK